MSVWLLCALLFSPIGRAEQDGQPVSIKEVELYAEETFCERPDCGTWVLNIIWRDEFAENDKSEKVSYDIEVIRTEQMRTVHFETIHVMANKTGYYHWKWTSSIPLQCTSHSVRLRRRDQDHIGEWTQLYTYKGKDLNATTTGVYPQHKPVMVGSNITFCCIVERDQVPLPKFLIQISNRTYISDPVHFDEPRVSAIHCGGWKGSMVFIGYPPDDQNLVCVTRDLSSVECNWNVGRNTHLTHNRKTNYTLNGRNCEPGNCNQHALMKQKTKWTLIARNPLGVKTLIDEADPTERVWLRAPSKISHIANARNVTLRWSWDEKNYTLFLMICQVKLNGNIYNKTFNGVGLSSAVLVNLQPFADYTAQVTCGSLEHFYKWGDWSEITKFSTKEDRQPVSIKEVELHAEETFCEIPDCGTWALNIIWRDEFAENDKSEKVSYDIEVIRTEQMRTVHFEIIHVMANKTGYYHWKWTSSIPLQCTSHSVKLRRRDQDHIGEWTQLYTYKGKDLNPTTTGVYPNGKTVMVGSNITFCCIVERDEVPLSTFPIQISNRTYISNPVHYDKPPDQIPYSEISCGIRKGSIVFIGYPPDDQNLVCVTRNLSSVECNWNVGRNTHLTHNRKTNYTLNGRNCEPGNCTQHALMKQKTKWTLIAKNPLGVKTLIDEADPTERVWLRAPSKISHIANARNVTLRWSWDEKNYASFLMICQVKLNGNIYTKTFNGVGLSSAVLVNLQPFANYTAQVTCGSLEHFYKWGDWSEITKFSTKEDIPEAVDVWIQYSEQKASVMWKPLTQEQSHGTITGYEITIENAEGGSTKSNIGLNNNKQLCYNITFGSEKNVTVSAKNSVGLSPPSTIIIQSNPDNEVSVSRINSSDGGFEISWEESHSSTCGYVVEWFPTYNKTQCSVKWKKIPECERDACYTRIQSGNFEAGVRYTISVYACTDNRPKLLKRSEGYAVELKPGKVQNLTGENTEGNLELSWKEVPLDQQKGFISCYKVKTQHSDSKNIMTETKVLVPKVNLKLDPGSYTFYVSALTSGGEGDHETLGWTIEKPIQPMIAATLVGCSAATLVFIIITVLCYRKRKWLKNLLYPDIPEPKLAGKWITKGIYCTQMAEGYVKCEIQEVLNVDHPAVSESLHRFDLISSNSKVVPAQNFYQSISESPADVSYCPIEKLTTIIDNPSYSITMPEPVGVTQMSDLTLEMQDAYLPAPNFVQNNFVVKDSEGYKPQVSMSYTSIALVDSPQCPAM